YSRIPAISSRLPSMAQEPSYSSSAWVTRAWCSLAFNMVHCIGITSLSCPYYDELLHLRSGVGAEMARQYALIAETAQRVKLTLSINRVLPSLAATAMTRWRSGKVAGARVSALAILR